MTASKGPVLVVLQLTGGNDYLNTIVPYSDPLYYDNRPILRVEENEAIKLDDEIGLNPAMMPLKEIWDRGELAILHGIGYENSSRSHFRSMDIWHTAEPLEAGKEGWLGRAIRDIDPDGANPVTAVNIGQGLPRALVAPGASVAAVADIETYGLLTAFEKEEIRTRMLERFAKMYAPAIGAGPVLDFLGQTGLDALKGADMLKGAPQVYSSQVEYAANPLGAKLRDVARVHLAGLDTRIFYTEHGGFDTHASQATNHAKLLKEVSEAVADFWDDLREHDADKNVVMFIFTEFGRRVKENGSGTDHGSGGAVFAIGPGVSGGMYSEYPDLREDALVQGDLKPNLDFRGAYSTLLEGWLGVDPVSVVNGTFEKPQFLKREI